MQDQIIKDKLTNLDMEHLERLAHAIPSMGGRALGPYLRKYASQVPKGWAITECGCWLGSGTAHLALGILDGQRDVELHCFDRWKCNASQLHKSEKQGYIGLENGQDLLPIIQRDLAPFPVQIEYHKISLKNLEWCGTPIGLYVDDASKDPEVFNHVLSTLGAWFVPHQTILILMDFWYFKKKDTKKHRHQYNVMRANPCFTMLDDQPGKTSAATFRFEEWV